MKVLTALDFGDASLEALRQARTLAHGVGATLGVCHVLPAIHDLSWLFPSQDTSASPEAQADEAAARKALEELARDKLGLELTTVFIERGSSAYAEIVRRGESWGADFVVVGSHGKAGLSRMILGSVAERVVRHVHCSVLVARPVQKVGTVLVATDLSEASAHALEAGAAAAKRSGARLVVLSVLEWTDPAAAAAASLIGAAPAIPPLETQRQVREALRSTLEQTMAGAGVAGEARVLDGAAASTIVACANELGAELTVVGTHGRTGLSRLALGSVAESVIRGASGSVLAVR